MTPEEALIRVRVAAMNALECRRLDLSTGGNSRSTALLALLVAVLEAQPEFWPTIQGMADAATPEALRELLP